MSDERAIWERLNETERRGLAYAYEHNSVILSRFDNDPPGMHWTLLRPLKARGVIESINRFGDAQLTDLGRRVVEAGQASTDE